MYFENKKLYKKYNAWLPHVGKADGTEAQIHNKTAMEIDAFSWQIIKRKF